MATQAKKKPPSKSSGAAAAPAKTRSATEAGRRAAAVTSTSVTKGTSLAKTKRAAAPKLLAGGNPQIAKGDGDGPVQAFIDATPGWKRDVARALDARIVAEVPEVRKAVKWNSPFYGLDGKGWFLSFHVYSRYVKVLFFQGAALVPVPPGESKQANVRYLDITEAGFDEGALARWIQQAAKLPGWLADKPR